MLKFDIHQLSDGRTVATCLGRTETGQDPCRVIARNLVDEGLEDQPWEIWRGQTLGMFGSSTHWLAASVVSEGDGGFTRHWWAAHPHAAPRPRLAAVVEQQKTLAAAKAPALARPRSPKPRKPPAKSPRTTPRASA